MAHAATARHLPIVLLVALALNAQPGPADLERARQLVTENRLDEALTIYQAVLQSRPADPALIMNVAVVEFKAKHYEQAIEHSRRVLEMEPGHPTASLFLGASYFQSGKPAKAIEPLLKVVTGQPKDRNARLMLAESLLLVERYAEAAAQFEVSSELLPGNPRVWYGLERSFSALAEQARAELDRAAPESAYGYASAADAYLGRQQYGTAFHYLRKSLDTGEQVPGVHASLAAIYRATGHPDWAVHEAQAEAGLGPPAARSDASSADSTPEALYWRAKKYTERTQKAYDRLAALPDSSELHELKARTLDSRARFLDAANEWRRALDLAPQNLVLEKGLAASLSNGRDLDAAVPLLEDILKRDPGSAELEFLLGNALLQLEQPAKAITHLEAALQHAAFPQAHGALGEAYLKMGEPAKAVPHLKESLATDQDGSRHFQLSRAYQAAGDRTQAGQALDEYRRLRRDWETKRREIEADYAIGPP